MTTTYYAKLTTSTLYTEGASESMNWAPFSKASLKDGFLYRAGSMFMAVAVMAAAARVDRM
jgi:hypothetical protein